MPVKTSKKGDVKEDKKAASKGINDANKADNLKESSKKIPDSTKSKQEDKAKGNTKAKSNINGGKSKKK
jgi:hypothetical protein